MSSNVKSALLVAGGLATLGIALVTLGPDDTKKEGPPDAGIEYVNEAMGELRDGGYLPFCACSIGKDCEQLHAAPGSKPVWRVAPKGLTLSPGNFRGDGCLSKACIERRPGASWPAKCPSR